MKRVLIILFGIALIGAGVVIYLQDKGYRIDSIEQIPVNIEITSRCSDVTNLLLTSEVEVTISNNTTRAFTNVMVKVLAYDKNDNLIKEKITIFERKLSANGELTKPITLPARTRRCISEIVKHD